MSPQHAAVEERWREDRFDDMARLWKLTEHDKVMMRELQERVRDVDHWKNDPFELVRYYSEFFKEGSRHNHNLSKVEQMFRAMIQWRRDHDMDTFLERYGTSPDPLWHYFPVGILEGSDQAGDPIYLDRMGQADTWGLSQHYGMDGLVDYMIFVNECLNTRAFWKHYEAREGRRVVKFSIVIDLHGLSAKHLRPGLVSLLGKVSRINQDYYAGWAKVRSLAPMFTVFFFLLLYWGLTCQCDDPQWML